MFCCWFFLFFFYRQLSLSGLSHPDGAPTGCESSDNTLQTWTKHPTTTKTVTEWILCLWKKHSCERVGDEEPNPLNASGTHKRHTDVTLGGQGTGGTQGSVSGRSTPCRAWGKRLVPQEVTEVICMLSRSSTEGARRKQQAQVSAVNPPALWCLKHGWTEGSSIHTGTCPWTRFHSYIRML